MNVHLVMNDIIVIWASEYHKVELEKQERYYILLKLNKIKILKILLKIHIVCNFSIFTVPRYTDRFI